MAGVDLLQDLARGVASTTQSVNDLLGLPIGRHGNAEVHVLGSPGPRAQSDCDPADEGATNTEAREIQVRPRSAADRIIHP